MSYLAVDPGDTTGVALIGNSGELIKEWLMPHDELADFLLHDRLVKKVDIVIVEDFQLLPGKAQAVSQKRSRSMKAARGIGVCEMFAASMGIEFVLRDPRHWRIGLMLAGIEPKKWPKDHSKGHAMTAYGAGFHALVELNLVESRVG
jgi:hypothetical protein